MSKYSRMFRLIDALTFGLPSVTVILLTIYCALNGVSGEGLILLIVMSLLFVVIYGVLLNYRWQAIKKITFSISGMDVICNDFPVKKEDMQRIVDNTISNWAAVLQLKGVQEPYTLCITSIDDLLINWETFPIVNQWGKFAGLAFGEYVQVGYKEDLNSSALAHEIGHFCHKAFIGKFDNEACHEFMRENGLP